jgi:nitroimidazol reductase NimA-like FMN-containing flavoprotein (pyridoxamine 5'-phosphate oxidase superfamily)
MLIREMTEDECRLTLPEVTLGRLACAQAGGQPYVVPVYLAFHCNYLYGFSSEGKKIECMRANPLVCVEIEDVKNVEEWTTLVVFGAYEELPDTGEYEATRLLAYDLLKKRALWWQPAWVAVTNTKLAKVFTPVFYRIRIDRITGHRAAREPITMSSPPAERPGLLRRVLRRIWTRTEVNV